MPMMPVHQRFYLVIPEKGAPKISRKLPALAAGQIAVEMDMTLPRELFRRPVIKAEVKITDAPILEIEADVQAQLAKTISDQLGIPVCISVQAPEEL